MPDFTEKTDYFETFDKLKLFYRIWEPSMKRNAVFICIHGAAVHSGNMKNFGEHFASIGYPVYAYDRRSFGHCNKKNRGHIQDFKIYLNDTRSFIEYVKEKEKPTKTYLIGHSNGGLQASILAIENPEMFDAVILSAPNFKLKSKDLFSPFRKPLAFVLGTFIPKIKTPTFLKVEDLCKDQEIIEERLADPLHVNKVTGRWAREMFKATKHVSKLDYNFQIPTLLLVGGDDREIDSKYTIEVYKKKLTSNNNVKLMYYEEHFHEHFNELLIDRLKVFKDISDFLELE